VRALLARLTPIRLTRLIGGQALYGGAVGLIVTAGLGVDPWDVFAQGVARHVGLTFGLVTNLIGAAVLLLWWPLRQRPGIGTIANVLIVGTAADLTLHLVPTPDAVGWRILLFAAGLVLLAVATGIYVGAELGAGPRDGLMLGVHRRFRMPIWVARTLIEGTVLLAGWLLGGDVGLGTLAFAVLIGPLCNVTIPLFAAAGSATTRAVPLPERGSVALEERA
jgi:uncharacterized membrane protein YczE